jgi:hypothetical protein
MLLLFLFLTSVLASFPKYSVDVLISGQNHCRIIKFNPIRHSTLSKVIRRTPVANYKHGPDITDPVTDEEYDWRESVIYTIPVNDLDRIDLVLMDFCREVSPAIEMEFPDATVIKVLDNGSPDNRVDIVFLVSMSSKLMNAREMAILL